MLSCLLREQLNQGKDERASIVNQVNPRRSWEVGTGCGTPLPLCPPEDARSSTFNRQLVTLLSSLLLSSPWLSLRVLTTSSPRNTAHFCEVVVLKLRKLNRQLTIINFRGHSIVNCPTQSPRFLAWLKKTAFSKIVCCRESGFCEQSSYDKVDRTSIINHFHDFRCGTVLNLRTTTSLKHEAVPRGARIKGP